MSYRHAEVKRTYLLETRFEIHILVQCHLVNLKSNVSVLYLYIS